MTTIIPKRAFLRFPTKPVVLSVLGALFVVFIGSALADRMEKRAAEDRLSFGMAAQVCVHASCAGQVAPASTLWRLTQNQASHSSTGKAIGKSMVTFQI